MADNADVSVKFGADVGGIEQGSEAAAAAVSDFGAQLAAISEQIQAQTAAINVGFAEMAETSRVSGAAIAEAAEAGEAGLVGMMASVREAAEAVTEFRESLMGSAKPCLPFSLLTRRKSSSRSWARPASRPSTRLRRST
jgi:hypothetical protein